MPMDGSLDLQIGHVERMTQNTMVMAMTEITRRIRERKKIREARKARPIHLWLILEGCWVLFL